VINLAWSVQRLAYTFGYIVSWLRKIEFSSQETEFRKQNKKNRNAIEKNEISLSRIDSRFRGNDTDNDSGSNKFDTKKS